MNRFVIAIIFLTTLGAAQSVTISPLNSEHGRKARGEFSLTNNDFAPVTITLDALSMEWTNGEYKIIELRPDVHVKLSEYSARIPAKQVHSFGYQITCDTMPCSVLISTTFITAHTDAGVAVAARLGTVAYICDKEKGCRTTAQKGIVK